MNRRDCIASLGALLTAPMAPPLFGNEVVDLDESVGNFRSIYGNPTLRREFLDFLINVFHLYPEHEFHDALTRLSKPGISRTLSPPTV